MGSSAFDDIIKLFPVSLHGRVLLCCANKSEACTWYEVFCCFWVHSAEHPALFCLLSCSHQSRSSQQALFLVDAFHLAPCLSRTERVLLPHSA